MSFSLISHRTFSSFGHITVVLDRFRRFFLQFCHLGFHEEAVSDSLKAHSRVFRGVLNFYWFLENRASVVRCLQKHYSIHWSCSIIIINVKLYAFLTQCGQIIGCYKYTGRWNDKKIIYIWWKIIIWKLILNLLLQGVCIAIGLKLLLYLNQSSLTEINHLYLHWLRTFYVQKYISKCSTNYVLKNSFWIIIGFI